jgi:hypothetical protein
MTVNYKLFETEADQLSQCRRLILKQRSPLNMAFILFDKVAS